MPNSATILLPNYSGNNLKTGLTMRYYDRIWSLKKSASILHQKCKKKQNSS